MKSHRNWLKKMHKKYVKIIVERCMTLLVWVNTSQDFAKTRIIA